jgi:hypothetical protein
MKWKKLFKHPFKKQDKKQESNQEEAIPDEWAEEKLGEPQEPQTETSRYIITTSHGHKLRIPFFKPFKRIIAFALMIFFFVLSQVTFASPTPWVFIVFLTNALILADYLWKTRRGA